jgi:hypothetical protein
MVSFAKPHPLPHAHARARRRSPTASPIASAASRSRPSARWACALPSAAARVKCSTALSIERGTPYTTGRRWLKKPGSWIKPGSLPNEPER